MRLLCIETSCDETAAAVVDGGRRILSSVVSSQVEIHARFGGVVPEIASRRHLETIVTVIDEALVRAGVTKGDLEGVAVTRGPGLVGALLVGLSVAKGLSLSLGIPLAGVNHIEGHLLAVMLEQEVTPPFLALVISGGHTHLYDVRGIGVYRTIGQTLDDAAGEAFDKGGKMLGLSYPAGPLIDRLAAEGDPAAFSLPRPLLHDNSLDFSFSGLKTALATLLRKQGGASIDSLLPDICASYQRAICDVLVAKSAAALRETGHRRLVVAGGVACNREVRSRMEMMSRERGVELFIPSPPLCGDNAAMLGVAADAYLSQGDVIPPHEIDALPVWPLDRITTTPEGR
ncbi:MAG: tRNA (adenosine(37)-N6)-threonylcarbamoyltransferase complex transferase subunit TsaD [Desulfuromonadia bacterium]